MRDQTLYDAAVQHVLETRGHGARVDMDVALGRVADELETFIRNRERIATISGTISFVLFSLSAAHEASSWLEGQSLILPALGHIMLAGTGVAALVAYWASRRTQHLSNLEQRKTALHSLADPALAPIREVLKGCVEGNYAVFDRDNVHVDRPIFASPHAVILFLPLQRHRNFRLANAGRPLDEQLKAVRSLASNSKRPAAAPEGVAGRNAFLQGLNSLLNTQRLATVEEHWKDAWKGERVVASLLAASDLVEENPNLKDAELAKQVAANLKSRGLSVGLTGSDSLQWLVQALGGTGDYGWIRTYLSGDDEALPKRRSREVRG